MMITINVIVTIICSLLTWSWKRKQQSQPLFHSLSFFFFLLVIFDTLPQKYACMHAFMQEQSRGKKMQCFHCTEYSQSRLKAVRKAKTDGKSDVMVYPLNFDNVCIILPWTKVMALVSKWFVLCIWITFGLCCPEQKWLYKRCVTVYLMNFDLICIVTVHKQCV